MIKCRDENVLKKLNQWYGSKRRDISPEELREFCKCSNLKFGLIQMGSNCDSMLLETERGSVKIEESGEIKNGSGIYSQFAVEWYDVELLERFLREDIKQIESGEKDLVCFGALTLERSMEIPKEAVDFLKHTLNIDLRVRKLYELFENLHDLDKKYLFPAKGSLEEALFREKLS